jgi:hypothetical protein
MTSVRRRLALLCTAFGVVVIAPSRAHASCIPGFDYGAFAQCDLTFSGGGVTDSYNSNNGTYAATHVNSGGNVGEDCTTANSVQLSGSTTKVQGEIDVGPGGVTTTDISTGGGASYSSANTLTSSISLTPVTVPATGTDLGNLTCSSNCSPATNETYDTVKAQSSGTVITLSAGTYVMDSFTLTGNSIVNVTGGAVIVYLKCVTTTTNALDLSGGTVTNASGIASNLVFMLASTCSSAKIDGGAGATYAVYAPNTDITISGGGDIYGAIVGNSVKDTGGAAIHYDQALANFAGGGFLCTTPEISRASPVLAVINGTTSVVQGTYNKISGSPAIISNSSASVGTWTFPYITGHMRAIDASKVNTTAATFSNESAAGKVFDVADVAKIPAGAASCAVPLSGT